jgi:hydrogenase expression/formation protein HypC
MCLAVPMKIVEIRADGKGVADFDGSRHAVDLSLVTGARLGCYVIVHAGYAIEILDEAQANATLALFAELIQGVASDER